MSENQLQLIFKRLFSGDEGGSPLGFALDYKFSQIERDKSMNYFHDLGIIETRRGEGSGNNFENTEKNPTD